MSITPINRRMLIAGGVATLAAAGALGSVAAADATASPALSCSSFLKMLGVNTHLGYGASPYADLGLVETLVDILGVRSVRDAAIGVDPAAVRRYGALADRGVNFCMLSGPLQPVDQTVARVAAFEAAHPGAVAALEGPNEIKGDFSYAGLTGTSAARAFMTALRASVAHQPALGAKPLVAFTADTRVASDCDAANVHFYPPNGVQPGPTFPLIMSRWSAAGGVMPGKPVWVTESGFHTLLTTPVRPGEWGGVDEETQAILTLNGWIAAAAAGIDRLYLYELIDGGVDPQGAPTQQNHFGLFQVDGTPKMAASAISALTRLLSDNTPRGPAPPIIGISAPPSLSCLRVEVPGGPTFLLFRNDTPAWDSARGGATANGPLVAEVTLASPAPMLAWDPIADRPYMDFGTNSSASLTVGRRPIVIRVG